MKLNKILYVLCFMFLFEKQGFSRDIDIGDNHTLQYSGYVGWQQLWSNNEIESTYNKSGKPELGLNIIYDRDNLQIFNQFRYGENSDTYLVYNFAQYTFNLADDVNLSLRGGKLRHELGLYNTTRVNPRTRQGVIQPQSIYWDVFDELLTSGVGVSASLQYKDFEFIYTIDKPSIADNDKTTRVFSAGLLTESSHEFGDHQTAALIYSPKNLPLLAKATWAQLNAGDKTTKQADILFPELKGTDWIAEYITFGTEYKFQKLTVSGEILWFKTPNVDWGDESIDPHFSLTGVYDIVENLQLRLNYNQANSFLTSKLLPNSPERAYRKDFNLGLRYYITNDLMLQAEGHYIKGSRTMDTVDIRQSPDNWEQWWLVGTNIVYFF